MKSVIDNWRLLAFERYSDKQYEGRFTDTNVGRQPIPGMEKYQEDNCVVTHDNVTGKYYLMVPGTGSMFFELTTEDEVKRYLG